MSAEQWNEAYAQLLACTTYRETMEEIYQTTGRCPLCGYGRTDLREPEH